VFWIILLVILGLAVLFWAGTLTVQGYLYTEPAADLHWRAPAAAGAVGLYLILWCILAYTDPAAGLDTFLFSTREDKTFNEFWALRQLPATGKFLDPEHPIRFRKRGQQFRDDHGGPWQRSDSQGIMGEVIINVDGRGVKFHPDLTEKRTFKIEPGEPLRFREEDGDLSLTEDQLLDGVLPVYHPGRFWANLILNLLHLAVWFTALWLLLRFQWPHALGLALVLWLAVSVPGSLVPTLLNRASEAGKEDTATERA
jgi:hypothetical protein